ncbi:DUF4180 domain-containing protein [Mucilaginibacter sp. 14171R-50]|nr:DUF4180 domain-containing protein [Mucilaginibacter sp. 14171R-50]
MNILSHAIANKQVAEIISEGVIVSNVDDALDIIGNTGYQGFNDVIIHKENLTNDFFDLKSKIAGEILQKFTNYRMRVVIVGDFSSFNSKSLNDFIYESNNGKQVNFLPTVAEALTVLSK